MRPNLWYTFSTISQLRSQNTKGIRQRREGIIIGGSSTTRRRTMQRVQKRSDPMHSESNINRTSSVPSLSLPKTFVHCYIISDTVSVHGWWWWCCVAWSNEQTNNYYCYNKTKLSDSRNEPRRPQWLSECTDLIAERRYTTWYLAVLRREPSAVCEVTVSFSSGSTMNSSPRDVNTPCCVDWNTTP